MSIFRKIVIRCEVDVDEIFNPFKVLNTGATPRIWSGVGVEFQLLLRRRGAILDVSNIVSLTLTVLAQTRTGAPFMEGTITSGDIDNTVNEASWADGTKQHISISFLGAETALPGSADGADYFLILSGFTDDNAIDPDDFGWTKLTVHSDGVPADEGPIQAGNLIPQGATYNGSGQYTLNVSANKYYRWTDGGTNDTSVTNGAETVNTSNQNFVTQGATITLNGTIGQPVTAVIRAGLHPTMDETRALVLALIGELPGVFSGTQTIVAENDSVTVDISSHSFVSTPTRIIPSVIKPANGANIFCVLRDGSATNTQFIVDLSATPPADNYKIAYLLIQ